MPPSVSSTRSSRSVPVSPVAHADREIFRTLGVGAPGLQFVVRRMPRAAELEIFVVRGQRVAVEHDLHVAAVARRAAEHFMLPALAELAQIGERAVRRGHAGIVFLDPPAHFRDQLLLQGGGVAEQALGVVVLGFQIFPDIRVQDRGIAQHLLPSGVLQPGIVVGHGDAVRGEGMRAARRDGAGILVAACVTRSSYGLAIGLISGLNARIARCTTP